MTFEQVKQTIEHIKDVVFIPINNPKGTDTEEIENFYQFLDGVAKDYEELEHYRRQNHPYVYKRK